MNALDILNERNFSRKINTALGISSSLREIFETQKRLQEFSGANFIDAAVSKQLRKQNELFSKFSNHNAILRSFAKFPAFAIPNTTFDTINSIAKQHEQLFGNLRSFVNGHEQHNSAFTQMNSLQIALGKVSGQMTAIATVHKQWTLLDDFEEISEQAIEMTNNLTANVSLTEEESRQFKKLITSIFTFLKRNKKFGTNALVFLTIIVSFMNAHQYYDFLKTKPEPATKEDLAKFERLIIQQIEAKLKEEKEYRTTNTICKVMLKPQTKTLILSTLPAGFDVIVLQNNHKWLYVSFINLKDNLPQTGWIFKKYLDQPK